VRGEVKTGQIIPSYGELFRSRLYYGTYRRGALLTVRLIFKILKISRSSTPNGSQKYCQLNFSVGLEDGSVSLEEVVQEGNGI
jgi:hypothetical protein